MFIIPPKAPPLPFAPNEYSARYFEQLQSALRLYFERLDSVNQSTLGTAGGRFIDRPYGQFYSDQNQGFAATNTAYACTFNQTFMSNLMSVVSNSRITAETAGVYNIQFSAQLSSPNLATKTIRTWVARNGTAVSRSAHAMSIVENGEMVTVAWSYSIDLEAGDYIEIMRSSSSLDLTFTASAASSPYPSSPSVRVCVDFVAPIPNPRPTPP